MLFFGKLKSTSNLHRQNPVPWNDFEECLKIERLMEDMHQEYAYMFRPYQHFRCPTPLSLHQVLAELRLNKYTSMPATQTRAQRPYVPYAYSSSSSESSILD
jgi:hypothetical protein